jgi:hypothetical protein
MQYNIISSFIPMDPNMYSSYYFKLNGPDPLIFRKEKIHAVSIIQL